MVTGVIGRGLRLSDISLVALLSLSLLPERAEPTATQCPTLEARV
jgi:hypothetical protein